MATSNTEICNLALVELGQDPISSLENDRTTAGQICRLKWPQARDTVLRLGNGWRCLKKRATLARISDAPAFGYSYQYQLPNNCFRVLSLSVADAAWEVEGKALLTDEETAAISYVEYDTKTDDVTAFDALLTRAIWTLLAADMAPSLKSAKRRPQLLVIHEAALADAKLIGALEALPEQANPTALLDCR